MNFRTFIESLEEAQVSGAVTIQDLIDRLGHVDLDNEVSPKAVFHALF